MTKERLHDLFLALQGDRWDVTTPAEMFYVESEVINWKLVNDRRNVSVDLEFRLFAHFGGGTENLSDISYCNVLDHGITLDFDKITSEDWRLGVRNFVIALRQIRSDECRSEAPSNSE